MNYSPRALTSRPSVALALALGAVIGCLGLTDHAHAAGLDGSFGNAGVATAEFPASDGYDSGNSLLALSNGKTVVAGATAGSAHGRVLGLAQFDSDGQPDESFGDGGTAAIDTGGRQVVNATAESPDGQIVAVTSNPGFGGRDDELSIVKVDQSGSLDTTFGDNGVATIQLPVRVGISSLAIDNQGRMLIGGTTQLYKAIVLRANADGTLDDSFASDGFKQIDLIDGDAGVYNGTGFGDLTLDKNNRIVLAMTLSAKPGNRADTDILAARLKPSGAFDHSFNGTGMRQLHVDSGKKAAKEHDFDYATDVVVQGDRIVLSGGYQFGQYRGAAVALKHNGSFDKSFSKDGVRLLNVSGGGSGAVQYLAVSGLVNRGGGKVALTGATGGGGNTTCWYLTKNGAIDRTAVTSKMDANLLRPAVDRRGRVLVGGTNNVGHRTYKMFAARFAR